MKTLWIGLLIAVAAVAGGAGFALYKTSSTPAWYSSRNEESTLSTSADEDDAAITAARSTEAVEAALGRPLEPSDVVLSSDEINQAVATAVVSQSNEPVLEALGESFETRIEGDRIESGVLVNLSELPVESLPADSRAAIEQFQQTFPALADQEVYVGLEGSPTLENGQLSLDGSHVQVGQLKLPLELVAGQLGFSQEELEAELEAALNQYGVAPESVTVIGDRLVITGIPQ